MPFSVETPDAGDNGSSWEYSTALTKMVLAGRTVHNVKTYGAVGDGTTLDTTAIASALAAADGGGAVYFPPGTYSAMVSLSGLDNVTIYGAHQMASIVKQPASNNGTTGVLNATTAGSNLVIRDLGVDGNRANNTGACAGIRFPSSTSTRVTVERCHIVNCGGRGMSITGTDFDIHHNRITGCADAGIGLNTGADRARIHHNTCTLNEGDGIYIGSKDNEASFNLCYDNRDTGINFGGPDDPTGWCRVIGNTCWLNDNSGLNTGGGDNTVIMGNTCYANGRRTATPRSNAGIRVRDTTGLDPDSPFLNFAANHIIVVGNRCYDDTTTYALASGALGQLYGIEIIDSTSQATTDDPDQIIVSANDLLGNLTSAVEYINAAPTQIRVTGNLGVADDTVTRSRVLARTLTDVSVANTVTETDLVSLTIPAAAVAAGDLVRLTVSGDALNNTGLGVDYTYRFKLGATTVLATAAVSVAAATNRRTWRLVVDIVFPTTASERVSAAFQGSGSQTDTWKSGATTFPSGATGYGTASESAVTALTAKLTVQMGTAAANADSVAHHAVLELVRV